MYDRKLLAKLSLCIGHVLSEYLKARVSVDDPVPGLVAGKACCSPMQPGCVIAVQTFGEFLNFNPHPHIIATDGYFYGDGGFMTGIPPNAADLEAAYANEVFDILKKERKISRIVIDNMNTWQHSGFNVYCGLPVELWDDEGLERLEQYIVHALFSQERMTYIPGQKSPNGMTKVVYEGKTSMVDETFTALDWAVRRLCLLLAHVSRLARLVTHIPGKGEQMVRYYGYYSNKPRGMRKKEDNDDNAKSDLVTVESDISRKNFRKTWARLIQKIYNVAPLLCPKCGSEMRIISFVEDDATIKKILMHLDLWNMNHDPPSGEKDRIAINIHSHRSFEWWEVVNHASGNNIYNDRILQTPYKDEYSQLTPYEY